MLIRLIFMTIKASMRFFFSHWFDHQTKHAVDNLACPLEYVGLQCAIPCVRFSIL